MQKWLFSVVALGLGLASTAKAERYFYIENPDPQTYTIRVYDGPDANKVIEDETGNILRACWVQHDTLTSPDIVAHIETLQPQEDGRVGVLTAFSSADCVNKSVLESDGWRYNELVCPAINGDFNAVSGENTVWLMGGHTEAAYEAWDCGER